MKIAGKGDVACGGEQRIFPGDSEVVHCMRALDWTATELGPPAQWPEHLATMVRLCLASPSAHVVWWGPSLTMLYNDACVPLLGGEKHPPCLGRPGREGWPELWPAVGAAIEHTLATGEPTGDEDVELCFARELPHQEVYVRFTCSPILSPDGSVDGVFMQCSETTEQVVRARRLEALRELAVGTAKATTLRTACSAAMEALEPCRDVPFAALYLVDDHRTATLAATAGLLDVHPLLPASFSGDAPVLSRGGPLAAVLRTCAPFELEALDAVAPRIAGRPWSEPVRRAMVLPIATARDPLVGILVVGTSPRQVWDEAYRGFFERVAGQLGASFDGAKACEDERRRAETLDGIDRVKTAFFSNLSHELRTPLTLMLGPMEDALNAPAPALSGDDLTAVHRNAQRLLRRVNTLLDVANLENSRVRARYRPPALPTPTIDIALAFRTALIKAGVTPPVPCPHVYVDREHWEDVVLALISDAFELTFEGTRELYARSAGEPAPIHELSPAHDSAPIPVPAPAATAITEPAQVPLLRPAATAGAPAAAAGAPAATAPAAQATTNGVPVAVQDPALREDSPYRRRLGTDPMPPLSRRLTSAGGGVTPSAPLLAGDTTPWRSSVAEPEADRSIHILVVDDNAEMSAYLRRLLSKRWSVECVPDGDAALVAIRARKPNLVLTDVVMPNLDGFGLLRELRADPNTSTLPVIMLSARAGEDTQSGLEAGADDYIVKPFSARELVARVAARLELHRLGMRIAQERAAIAEVFRHTPVPVCIFRGRGLFYDSANEAYEKALDFDVDVRGKSVYDVAPDLARQFGAMIYNVMDTGKPFVGIEVPLQLTRHGQTEDTYWTYIFAQLPGPASDERYVVSICNEVTEQVVGRKRLEVLAERADAANRTKDDFLAMLGHEMRNPLSPIVTSLQLMRMREVHSPEQDIIERQVHHLRRLVDDMLDVSRIARGKLELRKEQIEVAEALAAAIETTTPLFEQRRHHLEVNVPPAGLGIDADPDRMAQVFSNLMTNAAKYSEPGTRIWIDAERDGDRVRVRVRDEGVGISEDMIDKIFDMFVQQSQTLERSRGGLGLGLSIVKSIVELHGGRVSVRSEGEGRGTEFEVELPVSTGAAARPQSPEYEPLGEGAAKRILIVDDNNDAAMTLMKALERLGYEVAIAHDGPSALRAAAIFEPDIALLDIGLPVMDGYEVARRLLSLRQVHLVALSGYGQETDRQRSAEVGFQMHLTKPFDLHHLESVVRALA